MENFLPTSYEVPKTASRYFKAETGDNVIRILDKAIFGWLDWSDENGKRKPIRTPYDKKPEPLNPEKPVKHFWAFPIWDYKSHQVMIYEVTQVSIQNAIFDYHNDEAWGNPTAYDLVIKKTGEKMETKYNVIARPPKPLHPDIVKIWAETKIDLNELFRNGDPFSGNTSTFTPNTPITDSTPSQVDTSGIEAGLDEVFGELPQEPPTPSELLNKGLDNFYAAGK